MACRFFAPMFPVVINANVVVELASFELKQGRLRNAG
jgi:hypothetical protein